MEKTFNLLKIGKWHGIGNEFHSCKFSPWRRCHVFFAAQALTPWLSAVSGTFTNIGLFGLYHRPALHPASQPLHGMHGTKVHLAVDKDRVFQRMRPEGAA